jgi:S-formylglutathione hydrolase
MELTSSHKHFDGRTNYYSHQSRVCNHKMNFSVYLPPASETRKLPVLYFLSGLTCNEEIFMTEAQAQAHAKKYEVIIVVPDTSPRDTGIAGEDDTYDLGSGAGFFVDATDAKWSKHYQMYSYVTRELRELVESTLPIDTSKRGIFGHSVGGHGALVLGMRNPDLYQSISAFAPICAPTLGPWGQKAFTAYLGTDSSAWAKYDANELVKKFSGKTAEVAPILIDQGLDDEFLAAELFLDAFEASAKAVDYPVTVNRRAGYDHSYYFISSFVESHIAFHAKNLK